MSDPHFVRLGQSIGNLRSVPKDLIRWQRSLYQAMFQSFALYQFHDKEVDAILMADIVEGADVRMREFGDRFRFPFQTLPQICIGSKTGGPPLCRPAPVQAGRAGAMHLPPRA